MAAPPFFVLRQAWRVARKVNLIDRGGELIDHLERSRYFLACRRRYPPRAMRCSVISPQAVFLCKDTTSEEKSFLYPVVILSTVPLFICGCSAKKINHSVFPKP